MGNDEYHLTSYQKVHVVEIDPEAANVIDVSVDAAPQDSMRRWWVSSRGAVVVVVILALFTIGSVRNYNSNHRNRNN